jgi:hypothetical protein
VSKGTGTAAERTPASKQRHIIISLIFLFLCGLFTEELGDLGIKYTYRRGGVWAFSNEAITQGHAGQRAAHFKFALAKKRAQFNQCEINRPTRVIAFSISRLLVSIERVNKIYLRLIQVNMMLLLPFIFISELVAVLKTLNLDYGYFAMM